VGYRLDGCKGKGRSSNYAFLGNRSLGFRYGLYGCGTCGEGDWLRKMGIKTKIEYADSTVNPVMGCSGCELYDADLGKNHCYAATLINRYAGKKGWPKEFNKPEYFLERVEKALQWSDLTGTKRESKPWLNDYPRIIFVNDLSDGFCPDIDPVIWLQPFMEKMAESPHIWLLLTKWPKQMRQFFEQYPVPSNFRLGVSVPNQKADWRIRELLTIPALVRFVSCEPLLEPVDLLSWLRPYPNCGNVAEDGTCADSLNPTPECHIASCPMTDIRQGISWCIVGGKSGPNARPMHPQWARDVHDQCQAANVPFFFKQFGAWTAESMKILTCKSGNRRFAKVKRNPDDEKGIWMARVGKKEAGRLLDGREWNEFPSDKSS